MLDPVLAELVEPAEAGEVLGAEAVAEDAITQDDERVEQSESAAGMTEERIARYSSEALVLGDELPRGMETSLRARLEAFNKNVIMKKFASTDEQKRLLRPAMLEAILHHLPTSKEEFAEVIPLYLRAGIEPEEGKLFLDQALELVADYG